MAERAGGEAGETDVVFDVRGAQDGSLRSGELEENAFEGGEARWIEVLDDLDDGRGVIAFDPAIAVGEGAVEQLDARCLSRWQPVEAQAALGKLEGAMRGVQAGDLREGAVGKERTQQLTFTAAEVENALRAGSFEGADDGVETLLVEAERLFDGFFFGVAPLGGVIRRARDRQRLPRRGGRAPGVQDRGGAGDSGA